MHKKLMSERTAMPTANIRGVNRGYQIIGTSQQWTDVNCSMPGAGKEIVLRPLPWPLPAHSIRWRALLQMRQHGLGRVRIGDISDHPQGAARCLN